MEKIIEMAITELDTYLKTSNWYGRENEVVNLFAHKFLAKHIGHGGFTSLSQAGIEVAVKQVPLINGKKLVRKDLVIWKKENQTVWNDKHEPVNAPLVVIEWKINSISKCETDIAWLKEYTKISPKVTGYSVCVFVKGNRGISCQKIKNGKTVANVKL